MSYRKADSIERKGKKRAKGQKEKRKGYYGGRWVKLYMEPFAQHPIYALI